MLEWDIEVGRTYKGQDGRPRTVISLNRMADEVVFTTADNPRIQRARIGAFAEWAVDLAEEAA